MNAREPVLGEPLSPAEYRTLRLRAEGLTGEEVAKYVGISPQTVKNHLTAAYAKLGVTSAVNAFIELGWLRAPRSAPDSVALVPVRGTGSGADQEARKAAS